MGCTSAGEIGPVGYLEHSISGASFPAGSYTAVSGLLEHLDQFNIASGHNFTQTVLQQFESKAPEANENNSFAIMLIDGLSVREEPVTHSLQYALGKIQLFGGSAGQTEAFENRFGMFSISKKPKQVSLLIVDENHTAFTRINNLPDDIAKQISEIQNVVGDETILRANNGDFIVFQLSWLKQVELANPQGITDLAKIMNIPETQFRTLARLPETSSKTLKL